ncbi:MAG: F0F1 ATP synthase subunit B [Actinomycetales bacterium]|nr:F0F1 ATP synthase subunit B [Actinomycetales bacterium]
MILGQLLGAAAEGGEQPSILFPAIYDIIWGGLSFTIVMLLFWRFVLPRFSAVVAERSEKIAGGIQRAEQLQDEAAAALAQYRAQLHDARAEAARIRSQAEADREAILDQARREAAEVAAAIATQAQAALALERTKVIAELRGEVGAIALDLAGRIVGEAMSDDARARAVIDRFIDGLAEVSSVADAGAVAQDRA